MNLFRCISDLKNLSGPVVLVGGTFDGVHVGHQALIVQAQKEAQRIDGKVMVMTFDRHPASLLRPTMAPALLTTTEQKLKLLQELGIDTVLLLSFDEQLASITATQFMLQLTEALSSLKAIGVGASWAFGKGGEGNIDLLKQLEKKLHFSVITIHPVEINGVPVSSTRIRKAIVQANFQEVASCLGRPYSLTGRVIAGNKKGRDFGFPTANLLLPPLQLPPDGVYASSVTVGQQTYQGVANIGHRPTLERDLLPLPKHVEVHLFDFQGDLYGQEITMTPIAYLRPEIAFPNFEELRLQIMKDVKVAQEVYFRAKK